MTLGEKLQLLRRSRGLSQEQLAAELDVSRQAISKWECGDSTPDLDKLRAICTYFGVTTDYLIWERSEDAPQAAEQKQGGDTRGRSGIFNDALLLVMTIVVMAAVWSVARTGFESYTALHFVLGAMGDSRRCAGLYGLEKARQTDLFWHCRSRCGAGDRPPDLYAWLSGGSVVDVERVCGRGRLADRLGERRKLAPKRLAILPVLSCPDRGRAAARPPAQKEGRSMTTFDKVYAAVKLIPRGSVATYGQIAAAIGNKRLARVVGYALHVNPEPGVIPCHRVVKRDGEVSSAFAFGGANRQVELLKAEGVGFLDDSHVDMKRCCVRALPLILEE